MSGAKLTDHTRAGESVSEAHYFEIDFTTDRDRTQFHKTRTEVFNAQRRPLPATDFPLNEDELIYFMRQRPQNYEDGNEHAWKMTSDNSRRNLSGSFSVNLVYKFVGVVG